jgi:hypothetical protein
MDKLPVGTMVGIYDRDGNLVRHVAVDVRTGKFLEPVTLEDGQSLWFATPGAPMLPMLGWPQFEHGTRPVDEDDLS